MDRFTALTRTFDTAVTRLGGLMLLQAAAVLLILRESFFDRRWLSLGFLTLLIHPILNSQIIPRQGYGDQTTSSSPRPVGSGT